MATPITLCDYARTTISCTAARLIGRHGYTDQDREDLEQDLACDLLKRLQRFDPALGERNAYIARRVEAAASNLIRARKVAKRSATFERTGLREDESQPPSRVDALIDHRHDRDQRQRETAHDVAQAVAVLPAELRGIAQDLQHDTQRTVAERYGMSRRQLYRCIDAIRDAFTRCGLAPA